MKTALKIAAGAFALSSLAAGMAHAQGAATGTGTGTVSIVRPIAITSTATLQFGKFVQPTAAATVTISTAGAQGFSGVTTVGSQTFSAASFLVTGDGAAVFSVSSPGTFSMSNGASATIAATDTASIATGTLSSTTGNVGSLTFAVGGGLSLTASQAIGSYTGTFNVTVTYN